ncbi:MAG: glycosyltransferase family 2 protein [Bacteroidota bacterium]
MNIYYNGLSIIIPVYNEENAILSTIEQINTIMKNSEIEYEIIIVNDGSTDNTSQILKNSGINFQLAEHEKNKGYGAALKTGIMQSKYDIVAITDADETYPNEEIPKMFKELNEYNMIVGARTGTNVKIPLIRRPAKWFINKLGNYLTNYKIPDINSGLRLFWKKDALRFINIIPDGFSFTTTITLAMLTNDLKVKYVPINYMTRKGKSKIRPVYDTLNFIQLIIRTVMYFNPLKIFVPLSLILFCLSIAVFIYSTLALPKILDATVAILFIAGIQMLAIGMIADMIDKRTKL